MASLAFNRLLDRWKFRVLSYAGSHELLDHLNRTDVSYQDFSLTAAQMDTLNATPVSILPAPGAGLSILVTSIWTKVYSTGFTAFELGSGVLSYLYTDGSGAKVTADVPNASVETATDAEYLAVAASVVPVANSPIVAKASADVTAGTGNVKGRIYYRIVKSAEVVA